MIWSTFRLNKTRPIHIMFLEWFLIEIYFFEFCSCLFKHDLKKCFSYLPLLHLYLPSPTNSPPCSQNTFLKGYLKIGPEVHTLEGSLVNSRPSPPRGLRGSSLECTCSVRACHMGVQGWASISQPWLGSNSCSVVTLPSSPVPWQLGSCLFIKLLHYVKVWARYFHLW